MRIGIAAGVAAAVSFACEARVADVIVLVIDRNSNIFWNGKALAGYPAYEAMLEATRRVNPRQNMFIEPTRDVSPSQINKVATTAERFGFEPSIAIDAVQRFR